MEIKDFTEKFCEQFDEELENTPPPVAALEG